MDSKQIKISLSSDDLGPYISVIIYHNGEVVQSTSMDVEDLDISLENTLDLTKDLIEINRLSFPMF